MCKFWRINKVLPLLLFAVLISCKSSGKLQIDSEIKEATCPSLDIPSICTVTTTVKIRSTPAGEQIFRDGKEFLYAGQEFNFDSSVQAAPLNGQDYCWIRLNDGSQSFWAAANFLNCEASARVITAPRKDEISPISPEESSANCLGKSAIFYTGRCANYCGVPSNDSQVLVPANDHILNLWGDETLANLCPELSIAGGFSAGRVPLFKRMSKIPESGVSALKTAVLVDPSFDDEAQASIGGHPKDILKNWLSLPASKLYFIYNPSSAGWRDIKDVISEFSQEKVRFCTVNIKHDEIAQKLQLDLVKNPEKFFRINGEPCELVP